MLPESTAAHELFNSFNRDEYIDIDGMFDLAECKYHIREFIVEAYLSAVDEDTQVDIFIDAVHALQVAGGQEAVSQAVFGSPLHGVKKLRELITAEAVKRIGDEVAYHLRDLLAQEEEDCRQAMS